MQTNAGADRDHLPAYLQIASEFEAKIRDGSLPPGSQLPAQRDLAQERGVNVSTITRAYRELQKLNLVVGSTRRGSIVTGAGLMPRVSRGEARVNQIDLTVNRPATDTYKTHLAEILPQLASDPRFGELQDYQPPEGPLWAREAGQRWIALNGFEPDSRDIVVTSGAQHALLAAISSTVSPGDIVVADRMTYYGLTALAQMYRFRIIGIGSDEEGISAAELRSLCATTKIRAAFVVPSLQNPMVLNMSAARREELAALAREHDFLIFEDDVYGPMLGNRPAALCTLAPERTYHISALSKALAPGIRIGWLTCPPGKALVTSEAVRTTAWMPAPLSLLIASRWIEDGTAVTMLRDQLAELRARHSLVTRLLEGFSYRADPRCMFIWLRLPAPWRAEDFATNATAHGVLVMPSVTFACDRQPVEHAVRVNIGTASSRDELVTALGILTSILRDRPRALSGLA